MHELWKKIGTKAGIVNYRDITLVEHEGKPFVQFLREAVKFAVLALAPPGQCGSGMHAGSTDLCHMFVAQAFCMARARKLSCGMLYVDLVNAFSQVIRRIVLQDLPESQEQWMRHFRNIGFTDEEATQIIERIRVSAPSHLLCSRRSWNRRGFP